MIREILTGARAAMASNGRSFSETPIVTLEDVFGPAKRGFPSDAHILAKLECDQPTHSHKDRAASWATQDLTVGVEMVSRTSGNFGCAMSRAARLRGLTAHLIVPNNASPVKITNMEMLGGIVHTCEPTLASKSETFMNVQEETNGYHVHSSYHLPVIEGQGTMGLEILDQIPADQNLTVVVPSSGAGTATAVAAVIKELRPKAKVMIVEPEGADDFTVSLRNGRLTPFNYEPHSVAEGLLTPVSDIAFHICVTRNYCDGVFTVSEIEIAETTLWLRDQGLRIEASGAVSLAAVRYRKFKPEGTVLTILTGGNICDEEYKELEAVCLK